MARKYARDNRGRFASGGGGATARGGRLRTAAGSKRKTQTMKAAGADNAGVIKGSVRRDPTATVKLARPAAPKRVTAARPAETIRKPAGLAPGAVEASIANKARAEIKANQQRMDRADVRFGQITRAQREIDYKRENPIGGRAFRAQATKKLNKAEKKLRKSRDTVYGAKALNYQPRIDKALDRLAGVTRARNRANQLPKISRRGAQYQRSIFGGATVKYS